MEVTLNNTVQIIAIIGFAAGLIKYLIVNPLQNAIDALQKAVEKMEMVLEKMEDAQKNFDTRLARVEESTKSAHKRVDRLESLRGQHNGGS